MVLTQFVEALRWEIEEVRKELFDSPVLKRRQKSSNSGDLPTSPRAKRQRIVSSTKEAIETRFLQHRETVKTHSDFSDLEKAENNESSCESTCGQPKRISDFSNLTTAGDKWDLPHFVCDEFAQNDLSMFAEASSTIPDNTLDQQHMIDEILAENYPIPAPAVPVNSESNSSIPWSTYIATENRKSQASSESSDSVQDLAQDMTRKSVEAGCDSNSGPMVTSCPSTGSPAQEGFLDQVAVNAKPGLPLPRIEEANLRNDTFQENCRENRENEVPVTATSKPPHGGRIEYERDEDPHRKQEGRSTGNSADQAVENDVEETDRGESPENIDVMDPAMETLTSFEPNKRQQRSQPDFDETSIGLPKEQYKLCPSRSRLATLHTETIDLSIAPERAAKMTIKRRRTQEPAVKHSSSPPATNIEAMGEMAFTPNRSRQAFTSSGENLEQAADELLTRPMSDGQPTTNAQLFLDQVADSKGSSAKGTPPDEVLPSVEQVSHDRGSATNNSEMQQGRDSSELTCVEVTRKHSRRRQNQDMDDSEGRTVLLESTDANMQDNLADEAAPVSNRKNTSRKGKRKEMNLEKTNQPFEEQQNSSSGLVQCRITSSTTDGSIHTKEMPAESLKGKKRGHGRSYKSPKPAEDAGGQDDLNSVTKEKNSPGVAEPLKEIDANPKASASDLTSTENIEEEPNCEATPVEPAKGSLLLGEPPENLSEEPQQEPASRASTSYSPISKGKVPYRVGLSRKARIAPLLKVVRK